MECPHCKYKDGWDGEHMKATEGDHGDFFSLSNDVEMVREESSRTVYGCPRCNKIFFDIF